MAKAFSLLIGSLAFPLALGLLSTSAAAQDSPQLASLSERYWQYQLLNSPTTATIYGVRDYDDRLDSITLPARAQHQERLQALLKQSDRIEAAKLTSTDRVTHALFRNEIANDVGEQKACQYALWNINQLDGPQVQFLRLPVYQPIANRRQADQLLARYRAIGPYLDNHIKNLRTGLQKGYKSPRIAVERVISQLQPLTVAPPEKSPLAEMLQVKLPDNWSESATYKQQLAQVVNTVVYTAFKRYEQFLSTTYLPQSRTQVGVSANPGGRQCYRAAIRSRTSKDLTPEAVHALGLSEMDRIQAEMRILTRKLFNTEDLTAVLAKLREDPQYAFSSEAEIETFARAATERAQARLKDAFNVLPKAPVVVEPIPAAAAKDSTAAYYLPPSIDGKRPGTYFVNTYDPRSRPRYTAEVLAFHEAVPGHHLQIAIAQELKGLPQFRKQGGTTAFVEGWGLYTERLSDEMGLYSDDLSRLGMLNFDAWRAARLVVDSGMHALGWERSRAIDYMYRNVGISKLDIENEVDRYTVWPGQALAYKVGQLEILNLRDQAKKQLGSRFDLGAFHNAVLSNGAVTLPILRSEVETWLRRSQQAGP